MDMHIYRKFLNDCQLSGTKKSERVKYPFRKIDVYAVKIYRNNAYGNGTGKCLPAEQVRFTGHGQPMEIYKIGGRTGTGRNISAAGDFKLSGDVLSDVLSGGGIRHMRNKILAHLLRQDFICVI